MCWLVLQTMYFQDWKSGYNFQQINTIAQPGSIAAKNGRFCCTFEQSQSRFLTGECDKSIKIYKEDETATPETHLLMIQELNMQIKIIDNCLYYNQQLQHLGRIQFTFGAVKVLPLNLFLLFIDRIQDLLFSSLEYLYVSKFTNYNFTY